MDFLSQVSIGNKFFMYTPIIWYTDKNSGTFYSMFYKYFFNKAGHELSIDLSNYQSIPEVISAEDVMQRIRKTIFNQQQGESVI